MHRAYAYVCCDPLPAEEARRGRRGIICICDLAVYEMEKCARALRHVFGSCL